MRWTSDVAVILALVQADSDLGTVFGAGAAMNLYKTGERDHEIESLEYTILSETPEAEAFHEFHLQFDPFVRSEDDLETTHNALYALFHQDREWTSSGIRFRSQYVGLLPVPTRAGVHQGPVEYWFKVVRSRYH